jgi:GTP-sensing pleiotropic transcriptional regulator CodY
MMREMKISVYELNFQSLVENLRMMYDSNIVILNRNPNCFELDCVRRSYKRSEEMHFVYMQIFHDSDTMKTNKKIHEHFEAISQSRKLIKKRLKSFEIKDEWDDYKK